DRLEAGPVKAEDIIDEAKQEGIAKRTLDRAKKELGIKSRKTPSKFDGEWYWELPPKPKSATRHPYTESWHCSSMSGVSQHSCIGFLRRSPHCHSPSVGNLVA